MKKIRIIRTIFSHKNIKPINNSLAIKKKIYLIDTIKGEKKIIFLNILSQPKIGTKNK